MTSYSAKNGTSITGEYFEPRQEAEAVRFAQDNGLICYTLTSGKDPLLEKHPHEGNEVIGFLARTDCGDNIELEDVKD